MVKFKDWMLEKFRQNRMQRRSQEPFLSDFGSDSSSVRSSVSLDISQELARRHTILKDSNIKVRREEILWYVILTFVNSLPSSILGDNGSGQSTLARILAGLSSPVNGSINCISQFKTHNFSLISSLDNGREYNPAELYSLVGYCSQKDIPLLDNTIDENLKFFIRLKGANQDLEAIKKQVGLARDDGPRLVSELLADQRMMLNVSIVLLSDPQIIIMDEPTAGISPKRTPFHLIF